MESLKSLERLGPSAAAPHAPVVASVLDDPSPRVVEAALGVVGCLGANAAPYAGVLDRMARGDMHGFYTVRVRAWARTAQRRLGPHAVVEGPSRP